MNNLKLSCPKCHCFLENSFDINYYFCSQCKIKFKKNSFYLDLCLTNNSINKVTETAYKIYSKFYAPFALLVYIIIWHGNIFKHIKFFREILDYDKNILDIATGDGSLTSAALFSSKIKSASNLLVLDISKEMLEKAQVKFSKKPVTFIRGDVNQLPFANSSIQAISCFGGFNSFPSGALAMKEISRCLNKNGILRGSILLTPETSWKKKLIRNWIKKGYQTEEISKDKFFSWVDSAELYVNKIEQVGYVLLFELRHRKNAA
ncbi:class I SAM-dependent methyltransferase [Pigmentibacter sp. JX0631]|uniref:class I SAM-dependent methyltransferase n=1 Tax=Pigmentibacter sp. JX0631 TaxID=2976982 RepID=UPI002469B1AE|nr:class I SAM-dependent methyltransferase [Pigmentibacter sp. JX0631]WGL60609.1 class I SAM-dependent methyltransferase [Pigmentibacter sp. JX0631]